MFIIIFLVGCKDDVEAPIDLWSLCGDDVCDSGETLVTCSDDCGDFSHKSEVQVIDGTSKLIVNDKVLPFTGLFVYCQMGCPKYSDDGWLESYKGYVDQVSDAGLTYIHIGSQSLVNNFDNMDNLLDYAAENGVFVVFLIPTSSPTKSWKGTNPGTLQEDYNCYLGNDGCMIDNTVSFHNEDWWETKDDVIETFVERYKDHPAVLAWDVRVGSTTENNYGPSYIQSVLEGTASPDSWCDYSDLAVSRWHEWLSDRYSSDSELQEAWGMDVTLETAEMPIPLDRVSNDIEELAEHANSAGDTRRQFYDWHIFRLEEKMADFNHFVELVDNLDPNHIILTGPAFSPDRSAVSGTKNGKSDVELMYKSPYVDGLVLHPRVSCDDKKSKFNTKRLDYYDVITYANRHGKLSTWINEDTAEMNKHCKDIDSIWMIDSIAALTASLGGGCGWVIGPDREDIPAWSEVEINELKNVNSFYTAVDLQSPKPDIAVLFDPIGDSFDYRKPGRGELDSKTLDRTSWLESLYDNGFDFDIITVDDVKDDSSILDDYKAVLLLHLVRLEVDVAELLLEYEGGLFVAGRTGVYDEYGNYDTSALEILLDVSSVSEFTGDVSSWSFDPGSEVLFSGLDGVTYDSENLFYIPKFDGDYTAIGYLDDEDVVTVGYKDNIVFWFPRLNTNEEYVVQFQKNLWMFFESDDVYSTESFGGNYKYLFSNEDTSLSEFEEFSLWDWFSMSSLDTLDFKRNTPMFLSLVESSDDPQIVAVNGANIVDIELADDLFAVGLYAVSDEVTVVFDIGEWNVEDVFVSEGKVLSTDTEDNFYIVRVSSFDDKMTVGFRGV